MIYSNAMQIQKFQQYLYSIAISYNCTVPLMVTLLSIPLTPLFLSHSRFLNRNSFNTSSRPINVPPSLFAKIKSPSTPFSLLFSFPWITLVCSPCLVLGLLIHPFSPFKSIIRQNHGTYSHKIEITSLTNFSEIAIELD